METDSLPTIVEKRAGERQWERRDSNQSKRISVLIPKRKYSFHFLKKFLELRILKNKQKTNKSNIREDKRSPLNSSKLSMIESKLIKTEKTKKEDKLKKSKGKSQKRAHKTLKYLKPIQNPSIIKRNKNKKVHLTSIDIVKTKANFPSEQVIKTQKHKRRPVFNKIKLNKRKMKLDILVNKNE